MNILLALKENDWITINNILLEIYSLNSEFEITDKFLKMLSSLLLYDKAFFLIYDKDNIVENSSTFINIDEEAKKLYLEKFHNLDYAKYFMTTTKSIVFRDTDIFEENKRNETKIYKEFLYPNGMKYGLGLVIVKNDVLLGTINLFRDDILNDFTEKDFEILDILKEHLANIFYRLKSASKQESSQRLNINAIYDYNISKREFEIINLILEGLTNDEISERLMISISTVKRHTYNIFNKLGINSRFQLLRLLNDENTER